jgi:hypothetical protein
MGERRKKWVFRIEVGENKEKVFQIEGQRMKKMVVSD